MRSYRCSKLVKPRPQSLPQQIVPKNTNFSFRLKSNLSHSNFVTLNSELSPPCAVILTALSVEYQAVRAHLTHLCEEVHPHGTIYERGIFFPSSNQSWDIAIVEVGKGNASAAREAER